MNTGDITMTEIKATFEEPATVEQAAIRLKMTLLKYAGEKGDLKHILNKYSLGFEELLTLLESSLSMQKHEIDRLREDAKRMTKRLNSLSQGSLL